MHPLDSIRRTPRTRRVKVSEIDDVAEVSNPEFTRLYLDVLQGKSSIAVTRVSTKRIQPGVPIQHPGKRRTIAKDPINSHFAAGLQAQIRSGKRPALWLYPSSYGSKRAFICSDDVVAFEAYKSLGITRVPAIIMNGRRRLLECPALIMSAVETPDEPTFILTGTINRKTTGIASMTGKPPLVTRWRFTLNKLIKNIEIVLRRLRAFRKDAKEDFHYHHTLCSVLVRAWRILQVVKNTCLSGYPEQCLPQVRSLYDLALSLHLDWLAPEHMGEYFLWVAHGSEILKRAMKSVDRTRAKAKWPNTLIATLRTSDNKTVNLINKISGRAALSPFATLHKNIYGFLSTRTHQDFSAAIPFTNSLLARSPLGSFRTGEEKTELWHLLRCADLSVALICESIWSDTGVPQPRSRVAATSSAPSVSV
jgi:hypothetical protein